MDKKTKSILIGLGAAFAAVLVIILLFFTISGMGGDKKNTDVVSRNELNDIASNAVESDGNLVVPFDENAPDDIQGDKDDDKDTTSSEKPVSSEDVSSEPEEEKEDPFKLSDIEKIKNSAETFSDFVTAVSPVAYEWSTPSIGALGEAQVKLIADDGSYVVIGVPVKTADDEYTIEGGNKGSGDKVKDWVIYKQSKSKKCYIYEIVWFSNDMEFDMPRNIKIGTAYKDVIASYLDLSTAEKSYLLYEGKDVLKDSAKLKAYKADNQAYIGGKIYKLDTYLNSFHKDNKEAYPFYGKCNSIIRYGYNSIADTDATLDRYCMEYATKDHKVVGIRFYSYSQLN